MAVEQALHYLPQGMPLLLNADGKAYIVYALEALLPQELAELQGAGCELQLWLTTLRLRRLGVELQAPYAMASVGTTVHAELMAVAGCSGGGGALPLDWQAANQELGATLNILATLAEIMPAWLIIPTHEQLPQAVLQVSSAQLEWYSVQVELEIVPVITAPLHLRASGPASITAFRAKHSSGKEHYAITVPGRVTGIPLVRVHSSCYTGDLLGSLTCDCGEQLQLALKAMSEDPAGGILVYLQQEGRGIGLLNKLRCYAQQQHGLDTVEANESLGFSADARSFAVAAHILKACNANKIRLLTNNPRKGEELAAYGIEVVELVAHIVPSAYHPLTQAYMAVKRKLLGHHLP